MARPLYRCGKSRMDIIRQRKPRISTMTTRRKNKRWSLMWSICSNPITLTIVPSGRTVPLFIVNVAQQKIGTEKRVRRRLKATHSDRATNAKKGIKGRDSRWKEVQSGAVHVLRFQERRGAGVCRLESRS